MIQIRSIYNCEHSYSCSIPFVTDDYSAKFLRCWYTNADSLINKLEELKCRMTESCPDIVCITEVFPKHCVADVSVVNLQINGYNCYCSAFSHSNRGVCLYVKSNLNAYRLGDLKMRDFQESLWYSVSLPNSDYITLGIVYRSPNSDTENNRRLLCLLRDAAGLCFSNLLIVGDFNFPNVNWHSWSTPPSDTVGGLFLDVLDDEFLIQHVSFATRI